MVWNLDIGWLLMAVVCVGILAFILSMALNAIMGDDGFGPTGNAGVITVGFFATILAANTFGYRLADLRAAVVVGMAGAFLLLTALALGKAVLARLEG